VSNIKVKETTSFSCANINELQRTQVVKLCGLVKRIINLCGIWFEYETRNLQEGRNGDRKRREHNYEIKLQVLTCTCIKHKNEHCEFTIKSNGVLFMKLMCNRSRATTRTKNS